MSQYFVYILSNVTGSVLYIGVTNNLFRRMEEHRAKVFPGFSSKYFLKKLLYFEVTDYHLGAIEREKQLKRWRREKKEWLIDTLNPDRVDLYDQLRRGGSSTPP